MGRPSSAGRRKDRDRIVAFDLETTGLDPREDRIVEFAFIVLDTDLEEIDRWHALVNPGRPIPSGARKVHGIEDADVRDAPPFAQLGPLVQAMIDDTILMAYNHGFDRDFLDAELRRVGGYGIPETTPFIDPMDLFNQHEPGSPNKLSFAAKHYLGEALENAHRAIHDTQAMVDIFRVQLYEHPDPPRTLDESIFEPRDWVDPDRKLYRDDNGILCYGFGKHDGEPVRKHPEYARWMLDNDFQADTKRWLRRVIDP